jgi:aryl-alcohol dehydrogenase-like predicted oxidoreductase
MQRRDFLLSVAAAMAASTMAPIRARASADGDAAKESTATQPPRRRLGRTGLEIAPVVLGGNVFGWTLDDKAGFAVLDAFVDHGFDAIDTADVYSRWVPGNSGGESEALIGRWLKARPGMRDQVTLFTKVGGDMGGSGQKGLSPRWIHDGLEASLRRLGVETIDVYFSHFPDAETPVAETLAAYDALIKAGKIRAIGASNVDATQLGEALSVARDNNLPAYQVLQPGYNLYDREGFDGDLRALCLREGLGVVTYSSLASGFLTGKYRSEADLDQSVRGGGVGRKYLNPRGLAILAAMDGIAEKHSAQLADIALAWLIAREGVTAPIAGATRPGHVESFARAVQLRLDADDLSALERASAPAVT